MTELIAEVSSNHGGDLGLAQDFIWECASAGATFVKFQSYQVRTLRPDDPQREWLAHAELSDAAHEVLIETCRAAHVQFLTTVFHPSRVPFLASLGLPAIKIGSGEARELELARAVQGFPRVFVSLGLATRTPFTKTVPQAEFLRSVSRYPTPVLSALPVLRPYGSRHVGWSDHCVGLDVAKAAIGAGAVVIEKHVCLPSQRRPKQPWEATMAELRELRAFADEDPLRYQGRWQHSPTT